MKKLVFNFLLITVLFSLNLSAQYQPKEISKHDLKKAKEWVDQTYNSLSQDEKLGQLFIVALYTNKDENHINQVRNIVTNDKIGGLILMQDDAAREINLVNEFQTKIKSVFDDWYGCRMGIVPKNQYRSQISLGNDFGSYSG